MNEWAASTSPSMKLLWLKISLFISKYQFYVFKTFSNRISSEHRMLTGFTFISIGHSLSRSWRCHTCTTVFLVVLSPCWLDALWACLQTVTHTMQRLFIRQYRDSLNPNPNCRLSTKNRIKQSQTQFACQKKATKNVKWRWMQPKTIQFKKYSNSKYNITMQHYFLLDLSINNGEPFGFYFQLGRLPSSVLNL